MYVPLPQVFCAIWDVRPVDRKNLERVLRTWDAIFPAPPLAAIRGRITTATAAGTFVAAAPVRALPAPPAGLLPSLAAVAAVAASKRMYSVATRGATGTFPSPSSKPRSPTFIPSYKKSQRGACCCMQFWLGSNA